MSGGSHCPLSSSSSSMYHLWQWHPILHTLNSLWPSDAIWRRRSMSILAQVMACCLTAISHNMNQCWLTISKVQWHSSDGNFSRYTSAIDHWVLFENVNFLSNLPGDNELKKASGCLSHYWHLDLIPNSIRLSQLFYWRIWSSHNKILHIQSQLWCLGVYGLLLQFNRY